MEKKNLDMVKIIYVIFVALVILFWDYYAIKVSQAAQGDEAAILEAERQKAIGSKAAEAIKKGEEYESQNYFDAAIAEYNIAIEIKPDLAQVYVARASVYDKKGDYRKAISDYSKAINLERDWAAIYYRRARDYYQIGRYDWAWEDVHKAEDLGFQVNPDFLAHLERASGKNN